MTRTPTSFLVGLVVGLAMGLLWTLGWPGPGPSLNLRVLTTAGDTLTFTGARAYSTDAAFLVVETASGTRYFRITDLRGWEVIQ